MPTLTLQLTLLDDLVASERPATEGGHASLDYLPGAMLLGAAAAQLYNQLSRSEAYLLFHSGKVRFHDGWPLTGGVPGWPMPLCWHDRKSIAATTGESLDAAKVRNLQFGRFDDGEQPKQLRDGHIRADGYRVSVRRSLRMKTAIDAETGRVADSQLFGYEAIQAGQVFLAQVEADDDVPANQWAQLIDSLTQRSELLLGRSRSAEFGRVRVESKEGPAAPVFMPTSAATQGSEVTLWCLADLALLDAWGQPTLEPTPSHLGLARGAIHWERTFLRFRRYAPWNAHRRAYDLERQVIRRGSVITLTGFDPPLTDAECRQLQTGVGAHREAGLGLVSVNPQLLAGAQPVFAPLITAPATAPTPPPISDHPLIIWLQEGQKGGETRSQAEKEARVQAKQLENCYKSARTFVGLAQNLPIGPSPAQWGNIYEQARTASDWAALQRELFQEGDNALCKPKAKGWQDEFRDTASVRSFFDWFQAITAQERCGLQSVQALRVFCREAQRIAQREHGRTDSGRKPL